MSSKVVSSAYFPGTDAISLWHAVRRRACSFTRTPSTAANPLCVCTQKETGAAVPGKAENGILLSRAEMQTAACQWHAMAPPAMPLLGGWFEKQLFTGATQPFPMWAIPQHTGSGSSRLDSPATQPRSVWLRNHCWVPFSFVGVHWRCVPCSWASPAKCSDSVLQVVVTHP